MWTSPSGLLDVTLILVGTFATQAMVLYVRWRRPVKAKTNRMGGIGGLVQKPSHHFTGSVLLSMFVAVSSASTSRAQAIDPTTPPPAAPPLNLDLSSTIQNASANHQTSPVSITVGGQQQSVLPGQLLTPAQVVAVYQVMRTGAQNIVIDGSGAAISGSMSIGQNWAGRIASITVPQGVSVLNNASALNLTGNLTNAGSILVNQINPAVNTATISALNIFNQTGGLISST